MKVLVTGSAGRIGSQTVRKLLQRGFGVRGFDLRTSGCKDAGYEEIIGSLHDADAVARAVDGVGAVLHLGAMMSWNPNDGHRMFQANCQGTHLLTEAAAAVRAERFVFASSGEVYPENNPLELPITEDHPCEPTSLYGLTKLLGEKTVRYYQRTANMDTVILRFAHTQDARELLDEKSFFSGPRFFLRPRIEQQERFGNRKAAELLRSLDPGSPAHILPRNEGGQPFQMHIADTRDIVEGLMLALVRHEASGGTYNLGPTDPVDFEQLVSKMSRITGYPVIPVNLQGAGVHYHTSNEKIRRELEFKPKWTINRMLDEAATIRKRHLA